MDKLKHLPLSTPPATVNALVYRALGYRQLRDIPISEQCAHDSCDEHLWYKPITETESRSWTPVNPLNYTDSMEHALTLPYPERQGRSETWIHLELGEQRRWIVRLQGFHLADHSTTLSPQWDRTDHYVLDADECPNLSLPLAYCHIWLAGQALIPEQRQAQQLAA